MIRRIAALLVLAVAAPLALAEPPPVTYAPLDADAWLEAMIATEPPPEPDGGNPCEDVCDYVATLCLTGDSYQCRRACHVARVKWGCDCVCDPMIGPGAWPVVIIPGSPVVLPIP